jgi:glyoxylase-like metal-dependent hydrolase (beta-lactamase superfamily II)
VNATDDWYTVTELAPGSYSIFEAEDYGQFLVEGTERSVLVDAGTGVGDLGSVVSDLVDTPVTLVLTHTHWDHIGAAAQFDDVLVSPIELPADGCVRIDSLSTEFVQRPTQFTNRHVADGGSLPDGLDPDDHAVEPVDASPLPPDEGVDLGERTLEVIPFPGHSPGHFGLLDPATNILYGGDVVHMEKNLYVMFEDSNLEDYIESMERLRDLRDEGALDVLVTSHNDPMSGVDLSLIDDLLSGLREIAADEREYEVVGTDWGEARSYEIGPSTIVTKTDI